MNKDFLVVLLEKDIRELELLTKGFEDLDTFPKPIILLAKQKAENIIKNLEELENISQITFDSPKTESSPVEILEKQEKLEDADAEVKFTVTVPEEKKEDQRDDLLDIVGMEEKREVEEEKADFKEAIVDYSIRHKTLVEEELVIEEEPEEEIETIEIPAEEEKNTVSEIEKIKQDTSIVIETVNEEPENTIGAVRVNENIKINDIRQAINIGDRFRFQRELFGGNGEVMNKTIGYLNQLAKYEEAVSFLNNKFGWAKDNQHAEDFLLIVRRRYL